MDNNGKTISDRKDHFRNENVTKALKEKYGLTFGVGKEKVNTQRLKESDKTKYEIHRAIQTVLKTAKNWNQFKDLLAKEKIQLKFKYKGQSNEVQGISFAKGDYSFKGSEIDRQFSYSKIDFQLKQNNKTQGIIIQQEHSNSHNQSSVLENTVSAVGGLLDFPFVGSGYDAEEAEFQRQRAPIRVSNKYLFCKRLG